MILGAILRASGANGESDEPLQRAQAVDPENEYAQRLFSGMGPLYWKVVMVDRLQLQTMAEMLEAPLLMAEAEEIPDWLRGLSDLEQPLVEEPDSMHAARLSPGLHMPDVATEIPDWLQGLTGESGAAAEAEVPNWLAALTGAAVAGVAAEALADRDGGQAETAVQPSDEVIPDWITQLGQTGKLTPVEEMPPQEEEQPEWLAQLHETLPAPYSEQVSAVEDTETPDWLAALTGAAVAGVAAEALTDREQEPAEAAVQPADEPGPDWITRFGSIGAERPVEEMPPQEEEQPEWLAQLREAPPAPYSEQIPSLEDTETPDWLAALTGAAVAGVAAGALIDREQEPAEAAVQPADEPGSDWITRFGSTGAETPVEEMPPQEEEQPEWLAQLREAPPAPYSEQIPSLEDTETPDWLAALTGAAVAGVAAGALIDREQEPAEAVEEMPSQEEEQPEWLAQLHEAPPAPYSEQIPSLEDTETPDWLAHLQTSEPTLEAEPVASEETDWLSQLRASSGELEVEEEKPDFDLGVGKAAAGLAGLAGAALYAAHEAGEEEVEPTAEMQPPIDSAQPAELIVSEAEPSVPLGVAATVTEPEIPEEMPSADDALAFLAKLAAGKEDQLREQAQLEADARMVEIMGRKPAEPATAAEEKPGPIKMTVPAATVAAVAAGLAAMTSTPEEKTAEPEIQVQALKAEVPEEMPSADDALAFLAKLAAGKEDELRAQAEQEADARMAEIMGRKPSEPKAPASTPEETSTAGLAAAALGTAAIAAGVAATKKEEPPVEVPEEMPSADDALAFLAKLAEGKEDELRAQAEQEADVRMAAIMGRRVPVESVAPIESPPAAEVLEVLETTDVVAPAPEDELPEWLQAMRPTEEAVAETPASELPEWLRAMRPSEESPEAGLAALFAEEAVQVEETPVDELPEWLRAQQPVETIFDEVEVEAEEPDAPLAEAAAALGLLSALGGEQPVEAQAEPSTQNLVPEVAALEQTAAQAEVAAIPPPPAPVQTSTLLPLDWWVQSASDTGEQPIADLPQPYLSPRARAAEKATAAAVAAASELPQTRKRPQTGPLRQTGPLGALPQTGPLGTPEPAAVSAEVEALLARIYQNQHDHAARLDLARTYWATGNREGAYAEYLELVNAGVFTKETMADLETIIDIYDQTDWHRMLGDVYMKSGRLTSALEQYRRALSEV